MAKTKQDRRKGKYPPLRTEEEFRKVLAELPVVKDKRFSLDSYKFLDDEDRRSIFEAILKRYLTWGSLPVAARKVWELVGVVTEARPGILQKIHRNKQVDEILVDRILEKAYIGCFGSIDTFVDTAPPDPSISRASPTYKEPRTDWGMDSLLVTWTAENYLDKYGNDQKAVSDICSLVNKHMMDVRGAIYPNQKGLEDQANRARNVWVEKQRKKNGSTRKKRDPSLIDTQDNYEEGGIFDTSASHPASSRLPNGPPDRDRQPSDSGLVQRPHRK